MNSDFVSWNDMQVRYRADMLSVDLIELFRQRIYEFYDAHGRTFPWRTNTDPYYVFISEVMLQQTQTHRVEPKFLSFIDRFPSFTDLAHATLQEVLEVWQGLGYNRRAKFLHESAKMIVDQYKGKLPRDPDIIDTLPGIGAATAASIAAFAYNQPHVFIETNIRRVYIHVFFNDRESVDDKELLPLIEKTLDTENPRTWYWALMDYGAYLAKVLPNPNRRSKHYTKQSTFEGSRRQIRGEVIRLLVGHVHCNASFITKTIQRDEARVSEVLNQLTKEGIIMLTEKGYCIA